MAFASFEETNRLNIDMRFLEDDDYENDTDGSSESTGTPQTPLSTPSTSPGFNYRCLPHPSSSSDLRLRSCSLPGPSPQMEAAWKRIGKASTHFNANDQGNHDSESSFIFKSTMNNPAIRKAQVARIFSPRIAALQLPTSEIPDDPISRKAYALYSRTVGDHAVAKAIARDAERLRKTSPDGKEVAAALRLIAASRFKVLWECKSELRELILGATHMKSRFFLYNSNYPESDSNSNNDSEIQERSAINIERHSHHIDDYEEAKGVVILMGALFAEGIASYKDLALCLETLCGTITEERLEAIFDIISNAGDKICKTTSAEIMQELDEKLRQVTEKPSLQSPRAKRYTAMILSILERYFGLQKQKRERCIKMPGELSRRNRHKNMRDREIIARFGLSSVEYTQKQKDR